MAKSLKTSQELLSHIATLNEREIDPGLDRFRVLLDRLDNPQDRLPLTIHVAGTNAKGSTIAMLDACFEAAGYSVHAFVSPHLVNPHESIRLCGVEVGEEVLAKALKKVLKANDGAPLTVFEALTAAAFLLFSSTKGHVLLLETGMGGLEDCTNIIEKPALCLITPISYDHQSFLGKTLAAIAGHKAGILKKGVPCVLARQDDEVYQVIREQARKLTVPLYRQGREWHIKRAGDRMVFEGWKGDHAWPVPSLIGDHQVDNAGLALACLEALPNHDLPEEAVRNGLQSAYWPGRLEPVHAPEALGNNKEVWLDGGHNEHAARALAQQAKYWRDRPLILIWGMLKTKKPKAFYQALKGKSDHVYTVAIDEQKSKKPEKLCEIVESFGDPATNSGTLENAFNEISATYGPCRVLICGSLHLVGQFKRDYA